MRAPWRRLLAPLIVAAAVLSAGAPAFHAAGPAHPRVPLASCPLGTNWDHITQTCH